MSWEEILKYSWEAIKVRHYDQTWWIKIKRAVFWFREILKSKQEIFRNPRRNIEMPKRLEYFIKVINLVQRWLDFRDVGGFCTIWE